MVSCICICCETHIEDVGFMCIFGLLLSDVYVPLCTLLWSCEYDLGNLYSDVLY